MQAKDQKQMSNLERRVLKEKNEHDKKMRKLRYKKQKLEQKEAMKIYRFLKKHGVDTLQKVEDFYSDYSQLLDYQRKITDDDFDNLR